MASGSNSEYNQWGEEIPESVQRLVQPPSQLVVRNYYARLTDEQFEEVQRRLRNVGGNPRVQRPNITGNIYVVTMNRASANTSRQEEILQAFKSQDENATLTSANV